MKIPAFNFSLPPAKRAFEIFLLLTLIACEACSMPHRGSAMVIQGYVVDEHGDPVRDADLEIDLLGEIRSGPRMGIRMDAGGEFRYPVTDPGVYRIFVWDEARRVPDSTMVLNTPVDWKPLDLTVPRGAAPEEVTLTLPKPFGLLHGLVVDADTGAIVPHARVELERADNPKIYLSRSVLPAGTLNLLLPEEAIRIRVTAPGYADWTYSSPGSSQDSIRLSSGEEREVDVRLHRIEPMPAPASFLH